MNIVDAIVVYGQAKTTFGWPEHASEAPVPTKAASTSSSQGEEEETAESLPVTSSKPLSHLGRYGGREGGRVHVYSYANKFFLFF